jgi:restriction system protein
VRQASGVPWKRDASVVGVDRGERNAERAASRGRAAVVTVPAMPDMTANHRKGRLLRALFEVLKEHPDGIAAKEALIAVEARVEPTPAETGVYADSGVPKLPRLIRFATIPAVKSGWMAKQDGIWTVTDDGLQAFAAYPDPEQFYKHARALYQAWKKSAPTNDETLELDESEVEVTAATSLEDDEDTAREEILSYLGSMPPFDFQAACAKLVETLGHEISWISPPGPDGGLDFIAYADPIGATGRRIKGQVKRQQSNRT